MGSSGIRFDDCVFSDPVPLSGWTPPRCPGLYVLLVADPNWAPRPVQPLYFGEFGNNTASIQRTGLREEALLIAVLPLPFSTTAQRCALRDELIRAYNPPCSAAPAQLVRALHSLKPSRPIGFVPPSPGAA